jgi:restriction endonuclease Mrr
MILYEKTDTSIPDTLCIVCLTNRQGVNAVERCFHVTTINIKDIPNYDETKANRDKSPVQVGLTPIAASGQVFNAVDSAPSDESGTKREDKNREKLRTQILSSLDPNHTHFVLVDNWEQTGYGGEIEYRAKLEHVISQSAATRQQTDSGVGPGET